MTGDRKFDFFLVVCEGLCADCGVWGGVRRCVVSWG